MSSPIQLRDGTLFGDALEGRLFQWICPCPHDSPQGAMPHLFFYPAVLTGLFWVFSPPLVAIVGSVFAVRRRESDVARYTLWSLALYLGFYVLYFYQATRFMAAPATLLAALAAVWLASTVDAWSDARDATSRVGPP